MNMKVARVGAVGAVYCVVALGVGIASVAHAVEQGVATGVVTFNGFKGEASEHKPGLTVWSGTFLGASVTEARKGPMHGAGWQCTGEVVTQDSKVYKADGFCLITDPDGDTINLLWVRTDVPGPASELKTRGTYLFGTGKYAGIQGHYTFTCRVGGVLCDVTANEYKLP